MDFSLNGAKQSTRERAVKDGHVRIASIVVRSHKAWECTEVRDDRDTVLLGWALAPPRVPGGGDACSGVGKAVGCLKAPTLKAGDARSAVV